MRILIFHGYLLRGTGSNIYNANLARALAGLGHEVHLFCQDRTAPKLNGVTIHTPDIGRILPVYVAEYEGLEACPSCNRRKVIVLDPSAEVNARSGRGRCRQPLLLTRSRKAR